MSEQSTNTQMYVHRIEGIDPVGVMRSTPAKLHAIVERLHPTEVNTQPGPGKWSVREILCHIADCEVAWGWRLRQIYGADHPEIQPFDQNPWARAYDGVQYTADAALAAFSAIRAWNLALIDTLSQTDKQRTAHHPEIGDVTLWTVVENAAGHDLHHLEALESR